MSLLNLIKNYNEIRHSALKGISNANKSSEKISENNFEFSSRVRSEMERRNKGR